MFETWDSLSLKNAARSAGLGRCGSSDVHRPLATCIPVRRALLANPLAPLREMCRKTEVGPDAAVRAAEQILAVWILAVWMKKHCRNRMATLSTAAACPQPNTSWLCRLPRNGSPRIRRCKMRAFLSRDRQAQQ